MNCIHLTHFIKMLVLLLFFFFVFSPRVLSFVDQKVYTNIHKVNEKNQQQQIIKQLNALCAKQTRSRPSPKKCIHIFQSHFGLSVRIKTVWYFMFDVLNDILIFRLAWNGDRSPFKKNNCLLFCIKAEL